MGHLQIIFAGVCTHFTTLQTFSSDLPPHRVVLPVSSDFRFGLVQVPLPEGPATLEYYLQPHFVTLVQYETTDLTTPPPVKSVLDVPGFTLNGSLLSPAKIELLNATDDAGNDLTRGDWFDDPRYSLATYVSDYELSQETVLGGRAMCYVDLSHGRLTSPPPASDSDHAAFVVADIETTGAPKLRFTHLAADTGGLPRFVDIPLEHDDTTLVISNLEAIPNQQDVDTPFDFIQHYATAKQGIPQILREVLPGMPLQGSSELTKNVTAIATAMQTYADQILGTGQFRPNVQQVQDIDPATLNPSCSDSHYP